MDRMQVRAIGVDYILSDWKKKILKLFPQTFLTAKGIVLSADSKEPSILVSFSSNGRISTNVMTSLETYNDKLSRMTVASAKIAMRVSSAKLYFSSFRVLVQK